MTLTRRFCPVYQFKPRVRYKNPLLLSASLYGVRLPNGVQSAPDPIYVDVPQMSTLTRQSGSGHGGGLSQVSGLVVPEFSVVFANFNRQWKCISGSGPQAQWQFQGGDVFFQVELSLYVLSMYRPQPNDSCLERMFAGIIEHELLHIADEIDIVSNWLPPQAYRDDLVRRYLSNAEPLADRTFRHWFHGPAFTTWLRDGLWAAEHNRRAGIRDAPAQYRLVQDQINTLRARQINHGNCP